MADYSHKYRHPNSFHSTSLLVYPSSYNRSSTSFDWPQTSQIQQQSHGKVRNNLPSKIQLSSVKRGQCDQNSIKGAKTSNHQNRKTHLLKMIQILQHQKQNLLNRQKYLGKQEDRIDKLNLEIQQQLDSIQNQAVQNRENLSPESPQLGRTSSNNAPFRHLLSRNRLQIP